MFSGRASPAQIHRDDLHGLSDAFCVHLSRGGFIHPPGFGVVFEADQDGVGFGLGDDGLVVQTAVDEVLADTVLVIAVIPAVAAVRQAKQEVGAFLAVVADRGEPLGDEHQPCREGVLEAVEEVLQGLDGMLCAAFAVVFVGGGGDSLSMNPAHQVTSSLVVTLKREIVRSA